MTKIDEFYRSAVTQLKAAQQRVSTAPSNQKQAAKLMVEKAEDAVVDYNNRRALVLSILNSKPEENIKVSGLTGMGHFADARGMNINGGYCQFDYENDNSSHLKKVPLNGPECTRFLEQAKVLVRVAGVHITFMQANVYSTIITLHDYPMVYMQVSTMPGGSWAWTGWSLSG